MFVPDIRCIISMGFLGFGNISLQYRHLCRIILSNPLRKIAVWSLSCLLEWSCFEGLPHCHSVVVGNWWRGVLPLLAEFHKGCFLNFTRLVSEIYKDCLLKYKDCFLNSTRLFSQFHKVCFLNPHSLLSQSHKH